MNPKQIKELIRLAVRRSSLYLNDDEINKLDYIKGIEVVIQTMHINRVLQTICAMSNTKGGIIILGHYPHYESKNIIPDPEAYLKELHEACIQELTYTPIYNTYITNYKRYNVVVLFISQLPLDKIPIHKHIHPASRSRIRENKANLEISSYYYNSLINIQNNSQNNEMTLNNYYRSKYTDTFLEDEFINLYKKDHPYSNDSQFRDSITFYTRSRKTICYIMSFSLYPQFFYPYLNIEIEDERTGEIIKIDGSITQMFRQAIINIKKLLGYKIKISYKGVYMIKPEYHLGVIQELLLNALIHRDYSLYTRDTPIKINIKEDSLEIINPGYSFITGDILSSKRKIISNPNIKLINELLINKYQPQHGLKYILRASLLYDAPRPELTNEDGVFKAVVFKSRKSIYKDPYTLENIIKFCAEPKTKLEIYQHFFNTQKTDYGYFYKKYIERLVKIKVLLFVIEDAPISKNQKLYSSKEALTLIKKD